MLQSLSALNHQAKVIDAARATHVDPATNKERCGSGATWKENTSAGLRQYAPCGAIRIPDKGVRNVVGEAMLKMPSDGLHARNVGDHIVDSTTCNASL